MPYRIYDNDPHDGWAMVHRADCSEFNTRQGDEGWSAPYPTYRDTCDAAANQGLGTLYPCERCVPVQPLADHPV